MRYICHWKHNWGQNDLVHFYCYNINIDFLFISGEFFCLWKKKLNSEVTAMSFGGKKIHMYWGASQSFYLFLNSENTRLPLDFKKR